MDSLRDEVKFLLSGHGMPYEKVSLLVAVVISVVFVVILGNNYIKDGRVAVIDMDNSRYSRELIAKFDASPFIGITDVLNTPADVKSLMYRDQNIAVVYLPQGLEKNRYDGSAATVGVFYDNTNNAQTAELKEALNEIIALENQTLAAEKGAVGESGVLLHTRDLFNPAHSNSNGETLGFLFFFSSMFFVFATIGIIPRLRMEHKLSKALAQGNPFAVLLRLLPYCACLFVALFVGLAILRVGGGLVFSGSAALYVLSQLFYIPALGVMSLLFGWTAANPGVAASRMILFIPGGFILGGMTGPIPILDHWVQVLSHFFPLVWEFEFIRDILLRGASFWDIGKTFGGFMLYMTALIGVFCLVFHRAGMVEQGRQQQL